MAYEHDFIAKALPRVRRAVETMLSGNGSVGVSTRVYWQLAADDAAYPNIVYQSQDLGGAATDYINVNGWAGKITFRIQSVDPDTADAILAVVQPILRTGTTVDGFKFRGTARRPIPFPPQDFGGTKIYTAAVICDCTLG